MFLWEKDHPRSNFLQYPSFLFFGGLPQWAKWFGVLGIMGGEKIAWNLHAKELYIDYTKVCRTNTTPLVLDSNRERKALDRYSPFLFGGRQGCTKCQKNHYHRTHCFFLFFLLLSFFTFAKSTIPYSRNPGWETPGER